MLCSRLFVCVVVMMIPGILVVTANLDRYGRHDFAQEKHGHVEIAWVCPSAGTNLI